MSDSLHLGVSGPIATVTLTRPATHNAIDAQLAANLTQAFQKLGVADAVRVVVIEAAGESFCAGIDLTWMARTEDHLGDSHRDAGQLAMMFDAIDRCPKPVIAVVQGAALAAGAALVAAADMAVASESASFALSEVRLGLSASLGAHYLAGAIGHRACRRYMLTGERFDAREALRLGLVQGVFAADRLGQARDHLVDACLRGAPKAQAGVKEMLRVVADSPGGPELLRFAAGHFAQSRCSDEGQDGLAALVERRPPSWDPKP